ncbi:MAG: sigma-70 family RNA polymerase sigma factor [Roseivirga sp.]|nr:sigma-70 family RNA polymerase sigma factor [Roseivirga sp.]
MESKTNDNQIIRAILEQNQAVINSSMQYLYQQYFQAIKNFVLKNSGSLAEANDLFQDALVIFYVKVRKGEYRNTSSLKTYLFGIAKNLWLKELRRRRIAQKHLQVEDDIDFQEELIIHESQVTIRKVMELINEECKRLLMDFYFEGQSMAQLTVRYGLGSEAATKNKKYRCLQKLMALVKQQKLQRSDFRHG